MTYWELYIKLGTIADGNNEALNKEIPSTILINTDLLESILKQMYLERPKRCWAHKTEDWSECEDAHANCKICIHYHQ